MTLVDYMVDLHLGAPLSLSGIQTLFLVALLVVIPACLPRLDDYPQTGIMAWDVPEGADERPLIDGIELADDFADDVTEGDLPADDVEKDCDPSCDHRECGLSGCGIPCTGGQVEGDDVPGVADAACATGEWCGGALCRAIDFPGDGTAVVEWSKGITEVTYLVVLLASSSESSWDQAMSYCSNRGGGWMLASISQLRYLVDGCHRMHLYGKGPCAINDKYSDDNITEGWQTDIADCRDLCNEHEHDAKGPECYFPSGLQGLCGSYWSASEVPHEPGTDAFRAFAIDYEDGLLLATDKVSPDHRAICVRSHTASM